MSKKKTSRRALLTSVMALVMCLVMLVGTTFAWFTDSVTSGVNTIKSGNLDVALAYEKAENEFADVTESTKLFDDAALWEPGHVEYTVLKVSNEGSLALRYQLGINVAGEVGSTNVLDQAFQLSTYLRYAVLEGDKCSLNRAEMLRAAGDGKQLASYTGAETTLLPAAADMVTVVVWMPTTVGNEANHKTGVAAPSIKLGVNLVATQAEHEYDSFGKDYDKDANGSPDTAGWSVSANVTAPVAAEGDTVLKNADGTVVLTAPAGSTTAQKLTLTVAPTATPDGVTVGSSQTSKAYEITLKDQDGNAVTAAAGTAFTVNLFVGKNLTGVTVYHNDAEMAADYDAATGFVTFTTDSFSPYTVVYDMADTFKRGVTVSGIAGYENVVFATLQDAYNEISPKVEALSGLGQEVTCTPDQFDAFYTDGGKITWTIYEPQKLTEKLTFSFGRKASYYGQRSLTEINVVAGNSSAALDLSATNGTFALPYNWWGDSVSNITFLFKGITFDGIKSIPATWANQTMRTPYTFDGCTFNGSLYGYHDYNIDLTIKNCTFNAPANTQYAIVLQSTTGIPGIVTLDGNTFNGYTRGINMQRPGTSFIVTNNTITSTVSESDRGAIQITDGASFVVTGNTVNVNAGNAFWFHDAATNADVTYTISDNDITAPYLGYSGASFDVNPKITSAGNKFNSTDTQLCMKKGATEATATNLTAIK